MAMPTQTEHVERVEQTAQSSAGLPTRHLLSPDRTNLPALSWQHSRNGLALIIFAFLLMIPRLVNTGHLRAGLILLTISSCFMFFALWQRLYPFLIPACILLGLSIGVPLAALTGGVSVLWGLALGFLAILFLGRTFFNVQVPWPVYPAVPLFGVGMIIAVARLPLTLSNSSIWAALLVLGAGLCLLRGQKN
ncbi:MAG: hypothetical protein H0X37_11740 [Herpetosiphonaceae bacterium]|nr:hypothetical protein [Herpetosiphonaceae bacterium]